MFTWVLGLTWVRGCFHCLSSSRNYNGSSSQTFRAGVGGGGGGALSASVDRCAEIKSAPSVGCGVTSSGRGWRKVPESDARSVYCFADRPRKSVAGWCRQRRSGL